MTKKDYMGKLVKYLSPLMFFALIIKISSIYTDNNNLDMYLSNIMYISIITSIAIYYIVLNNKKINSLLITILFIDILYVAINTYFQLIENPMLARIMATGKEQLLGDATYYAIGSYAYFYSLVMIMILLINFLLIKNHKRTYKLILIPIVIFLIMLIIQAQFTIAIFLLIMCIILLVLDNLLNKAKNKELIIFLVLIVLLFFIMNIPNILKGIYDLKIFPDTVQIRIDELYKAFTQSGNMEESTDLKTRLKLYFESINTFTSNIFIGSFGEDKVGGHSTWLDFIGLYGMFSLLLFIYLFNLYKFIKKRINTEGIKVYNIIWLYLIILGFINTLFFTKIFLTLLLITPLAINMMYDNQENKVLNNK